MSRPQGSVRFYISAHSSAASLRTRVHIRHQCAALSPNTSGRFHLIFHAARGETVEARAVFADNGRGRPQGSALDVGSLHAADAKQMVVVCDHDSQAWQRRTVRCAAWKVGTALAWEAAHARNVGFAGATVACEPTGHRWRVLGELAADRGMPFVCVQPVVTSWARRSEDLTWNKTDEKTTVLIVRLTAQPRCYVPEPVD
jgi:hypothetical protein